MSVRLIFDFNQSALDVGRQEVHLAMPLLSGPGYETICGGESEVFDFSDEHFIAESNGWLTAAYCRKVDLPLADLVRDIYRDAFNRLESCQLIRFWAYVPQLNDESYTDFCIGRNAAYYERYGMLASEAYCASTVVGSGGDQLVIIALATHRRVMHLENSLQVPAYHSMRENRPVVCMSRASYSQGESPALYISCANAIQGLDCVAPYRTEAQLEALSENLDRIVAESVAVLGGDTASMGPACARGYVRDPADAELFRQCIESHAWCAAERVNILRADLSSGEMMGAVELSWPAAYED